MNALQSACTEANVIFKQVPADGKWHQTGTADKHGHDDAGRIKLFADGTGGMVHNWRESDKPTLFWYDSEANLSPAELSDRRRRAAEERERASAEQTEQHRKAARVAESLTSQAAAVLEHRYLSRKRVRPTDTMKTMHVDSVRNILGYSPKARGEHLTGDLLIIPIEDGTGITSVEMIDGDGRKSALSGGRKSGAHWSTCNLPSTVETIVIAEGVATALTAAEILQCPGIAALSCSNLLKVSETTRRKYPKSKIIILGDIGNGEQKAREAAAAVNGVLLLPELPQGSVGSDFNDVMVECGADEARRQLQAFQSEPQEAPSNRVTVVSAFDFMSMDFPPRETLLSPWLCRQGLAMVYAPRGIGKTHFSLGVAYAVASGGQFMGWRAETPRGVLFLDGEMPAVALQERIAHIAASSDKAPAAPFKIVTPDLQSKGMIDLSRPEDQAALEPFMEGIDLIITDNLSTLCRTGKENEGEGWMPVQSWGLKQRAAGRSVLYIHHAGKNGEQRGTSRREDVLDTVISLKRPGDYTPDMGACFEVHFEKARGLYGEDTKPFEARLMTTPDGLQSWAMKHLEDSTAEKVAKLLNEGIPQSEISDLLNISKGAVSKAKTKAVNMGLLSKR